MVFIEEEKVFDSVNTHPQPSLPLASVPPLATYLWEENVLLITGEGRKQALYQVVLAAPHKVWSEWQQKPTVKGREGKVRHRV